MYKVKCPRCGEIARPTPFSDQKVCSTRCDNCRQSFWFDVQNCAASIEYPSSKPSQADRIQQLEQRIAKAESALELIATPKRPDGTWNRDREACRVLAAEALEDLK